MNAIGISRLGQVHIPAQDVERATGFYKDMLGLPLLFTTNGMAFFNCGGVRLMLSRPEGTDSQSGSILYFSVPDIAAAHGSKQNREKLQRCPRTIYGWLSFAIPSRT